MNSGGFSPILESTLLKFNGGLFAEASAIALDRDQMELLLKASEADWRYVEPAIFGTLLERALNPRERHKLGAHYTPRAYVERLVLPTVIEPLRAEWKEVQAAALTYESLGKHKEAVEEVKAFQRNLCDVRVLDPACGSGNFLYVTLEHMKRLEGEVLNLLGDLGQTGMLDTEGLTVDPHQFLGLEINPRAARIAEMVLWIGYLQWHFRTHGKVNPPEPVLRDFHNIEHRDALITYDAVDLVTDESGKPFTRWDGITTKTSPITGEQVPDESAQVEQYIYRNPRKAEWPQADYIVGNPPFIGASTMRRALGDGYVEAVRSTWPEVPESADFVMHWWHIAAEAVRAEAARRFGFITTNSIKQTFNRRVVQAQLEAKNPLSLAFAIPDHPWVDAGDGAQVRIAMTVGAKENLGRLLTSTAEASTGVEELSVTLAERSGVIHADLKVGANLPATNALNANGGLCYRGVQPIGMGFVVTPDEADALGMNRDPKTQQRIRPYRNGKDIMDRPRGVYIIDLFGLSAEEAKHEVPAIYQWVMDRVKPERDHNKRDTYRVNWWIFGEPVPATRRSFAGLGRYIATTMTAKHRLFSFLEANILPDQKLVTVGTSDAFHLGVLSSRIHALWALATGGNLGVGNDPVYAKGRSFDTYAFPHTTSEQQEQIRELAERLDAHRKRQQAQHPELTLTGMYNVLEKIRAGESLSAKEKTIHEHGLVSLLRELHDELDRAVFAAYGWDDLAEHLVGRPGATTPLSDKPEAQAAAEEELLSRLVALNIERTAEEARGHIRWLRPEYQNPSATVAPEQSEAVMDDTTDFESIPAAAAATGKLTWPKQMREQVAAVRHALSQSPLPADALAAQFKRSPKVAVQAVLDALEELGMVQQDADQYRLAG